MRTLYLRAGLTAQLPANCIVYHVTPLLRELIVEAVRIKKLRVDDRLHCALGDLLMAQLESASPLSRAALYRRIREVGLWRKQ